MRTTTLNPVSLNDVTDLENSPYIIEGGGYTAMQFFFEPDKNRDDYLNMELHGGGDLSALKKIFDDMATTPIQARSTD